MGQDHIRYDILAQDALRGVIRKVLAEVSATGHLPGDHHFFITFLTGAPGVRTGTGSRSLRLQPLLAEVVRRRGSDLLLVAGSAPGVRVDGAVAAQYLAELRKLLEAPMSLLV